MDMPQDGIYTKTELKPAKQEPVSMFNWRNGSPVSLRHAAPVERQWVDLTDDEIEEIGKSYFDEWSFGFARAVIAADREKNK